MKRLFEVNGAFFDNKKDAKEARGDLVSLGNDNGSIVPQYKHVIHRGPDHYLGSSK